MRKSSGGERAWFLEEESEPRNKRIFIAGENSRADESVCLTVLKIIMEMEMFILDEEVLTSQYIMCYL
jgi:hypothetical protein